MPRREFLIRFCQGAGAVLVPKRLFGFHELLLSGEAKSNDSGVAYFQPRYRTPRSLDATLGKVQPGLDEFTNEKYAAAISTILDGWSTSLLRVPADVQAIGKALASDFEGASVKSSGSKQVRAGSPVEVWRNHFANDSHLGATDFLREWKTSLSTFTKIITAEFQITRIESEEKAGRLDSVRTRVRYELVGEGKSFHRNQRVGEWDITWSAAGSGFAVQNWRAVEEVQARALTPIYVDVTASALSGNASYASQLLHGSDYWRTILDGASGIDIYGHNGVSVADVDNDGFDDVYICQPAGLPNRLYRNRGDGTFEDVTEKSGLGILENTVCALFADFNNDGHQDVVIVRANGPVLYLNDGSGKFHPQADAFQFANPPRGTFTGAAAADFNRDGWLDIYFCLYAYYQGTGQYRYPIPYHDAENGPPNFLFRNNGDGTFRDATEQSGLNKNNTRYSFCCEWSDLDRDGWPDLYVVNDFGRKNLYRNNGDGTFTDVAPQAGVEDVGAGMSVCWFDYDRDGAEDLYVANMWTAAGVRVSTQPNFKSGSPENVRTLYQKHAMGNSLYRNDAKKFEEKTIESGVGNGRWSWSSDALDFDHDGLPDLYVTNGMVSGPSHRDLNSFFWRQVVSRSPDDTRATQEYEQGWSAINELIRSDESWSGYERNIFYANNGDGTFSDVSGAVGLDFIEDGRSFALADFDRDGRQEIFLKNRNAPQIRVLKNVVEQLPPAISFRLHGTKSNRDAIGAAITVDTGSSRQTRILQAGSAFLAQHSKEIFFGLGSAKGTLNASIRWPSGLVQELRELPINHRIWVEEGSKPSQMEPFKVGSRKFEAAPTASETLPDKVETWLLVPVSAPDFSLLDLSGQVRTLAKLRGKPVLLHFWSVRSQNAAGDLDAIRKLEASSASTGLRIVSINVDAPDSLDKVRVLIRSSQGAFPVVRASDEIGAVYNILFRQLFDRHRDLPLPTSFLLNSNGEIVKVYQGTIEPADVEHDFQSIPQSEAERLARGLPFPSMNGSLEFGRNNLSFGALFFQRGYLEQAEAFFQQAFKDDSSSAEALYGIGSVYLNQNRNAEARDVFERTVKLQASYPDTLPDAWNNLGVIATREGRMEDSIRYFKKALELSPHHVVSLDNLGNAYRSLKRWDDARKEFESAVAVSPEDPEANYGLGMVYAQTNESGKAYEYLQRALKARSDYPEALNNLGVLYLVTRRRDQAVQSFEQCIRAAPAFDQAYLNLARVYALEGARDKARGLLEDLLKQHPDHAQAKQMLQQLEQ